MTTNSPFADFAKKRQAPRQHKDAVISAVLARSLSDISSDT